jgi:hypothetical protein
MGAAAAFLGPAGDLALVGSCLDQQVGGVASAGFTGGALMKAEQDPSGVSKKVDPPSSSHGDGGQCLGFLLAGELAEVSVVTCGTVDPGQPEPVGIYVTHVTILESCARACLYPHDGGFPGRALSSRRCW